MDGSGSNIMNDSVLHRRISHVVCGWVRDSLRVRGKFFLFFFPDLLGHFVIWRRLECFWILTLEISEVEKVMIMGLQRHHVYPAQPGQGGEDPHVPHRLSLFVNFILKRQHAVRFDPVTLQFRFLHSYLWLFPSLGTCDDCREEKNDEDGAQYKDESDVGGWGVPGVPEVLVMAARHQVVFRGVVVWSILEKFCQTDFIVRFPFPGQRVLFNSNIQ